MRILIVGSGGREHALAWKLRQNRTVDELYIAPGNGGTGQAGLNIPIRDDDIPGLTAFALEQRIDLVVPGPELPLTLGITDAMRGAGIRCFGPSAACAKLEGSKAFAKEIMLRAGVPTAQYSVFTRIEDAEAFLAGRVFPLVLKADGLAAGKGVIIAQNMDEAGQALREIFVVRKFGAAGSKVIIEEFLQGEEVSLLCFCDGETAVPLPSAQDHKAVFDGDTGPNTGGMGAYSPAPILPDAQLEKMADLAIRPVLTQLAREGTPFTGILYAGLMMTGQGPKVLEYNVRFGDPECQPLLMRLDNDLAELMLACVDQKLAGQTLRIKPESALGVVLTAQGYPGGYAKGLLIDGIADAEELNGVKVFQAGTRLDDGRLKSDGGRVLCVTALGHDLKEAQTSAYAAIRRIRMDKSYYRSDIGQKGLNRGKNHD